MNGLTHDGLVTITQKIYIVYSKFCFVLFVLFILITNQAALEKKPSLLKALFFFFLCNV